MSPRREQVTQRDDSDQDSDESPSQVSRRRERTGEMRAVPAGAVRLDVGRGFPWVAVISALAALASGGVGTAIGRSTAPTSQEVAELRQQLTDLRAPAQDKELAELRTQVQALERAVMSAREAEQQDHVRLFAALTLAIDCVSDQRHCPRQRLAAVGASLEIRGGK